MNECFRKKRHGTTNCPRPFLDVTTKDRETRNAHLKLVTDVHNGFCRTTFYTIPCSATHFIF